MSINNVIKQCRLIILGLCTLLFSSLSYAVTVQGSGSTFEVNIGNGFDGEDGEDRKAVFVAAAQFWADILVSPATIVIDAEFSSTLFCDTSSATLGSAGPASINLSNAISIGLQNNVWYPTALVNAYNGSDRFPSSGDINATFNADLGNSDCLPSRSWYYGLDDNTPSAHINFYDIVRHELGHGLGITSLVNSDGSYTSNKVDIFTTFLHDQSTDKDWTAMDNTERNTSSTNNSNLVWSGANVNNLSGDLTAGVNSGKVRMYAPNAYNSGSSTSHFDTALTPNELMEPQYNSNSTYEHTIALLKDIGWPVVTTNNDNNNPSNNVPIINGQSSLSTNEDTSLTLTLNDLTVSDTDNTYPTDFSLTVNNGNNYGVSGSTITPNNNYSGTLTVPVSVNDGTSNSDIFDVAITVNAINDAPTITGQSSLSTNEDTSLTLTLNDLAVTDTDNTYPTDFSLTVSGGNNYSVSGSTITPNANYSGSLTVPISVNDGTSNSNTFNVTITVNAVNDIPEITGTPSSVINEGFFYSFTPTVSDTDSNDTQTFSISNKPSWASFSTSTGTLSGTTTNNDVGTNSGIVITVTDNAGSTDSLAAFSITVSNVNSAPVITGSPTTTVAEDNTYSFTPTANDIDVDDTQTFNITNKPSWADFNDLTGTLSGIPTNDDVGISSNIVITVTDNAGKTNSLSAFNITVSNVNDAPVIIGSPITSITAGNTYSFTPEANDIDIDDSYTFSITNKPNWADFNDLTGTLSGIPTNSDVGTSSNIVITVTDSAAESASLAAFSIEVINLNSAPVINLPDDIEVNATALFTKVDLGVATATNNAGEQIPASLVESINQFSPGNHVVSWQAQDSNGLQATAEQQLAIHPLINITKDRQGIEGQSYTIAVYLNGKSPSYPVIVPFTVGGSSDDADHDLIDGELIINDGLIGYIEFNTLADEIIESNETVIITLNSGTNNSINLGTNSAFTLTITEENIAPQVNVATIQNNELRTLIDKTLGTVVINSSVFDANTNDNHTYIWTSVSNDLIDIDADETSFTFDPANLIVGQQTLILTVTDNSNVPLSTQSYIYLDISEALTLLTTKDTDGDSIPDVTEGYGDTDNDGIANYLDNNETSCNIQPAELSDNNQNIVETEIGTCLRRGLKTTNNDSGSLLLNVDEIIKDEDATNVGGIFDFILSGLPVAGESISLVLPQQLPIPENAVYRKLNADNIWVEFAVNENNYYSSAAGEKGYCPSPNHNSWKRGLTKGDWCVQITIEDGGDNDDDKLANKQIIDPSGVGVLINSNTLPNIQNEQVTTPQNKSITIDVLANDTDEDGDSLSLISANADFGNVTIINQQLNYQPDLNFFGTATISYSVSDDNSGTGFGEVIINVIENTPPTTTNDTASTDDKTAITIDVLANDTDVNNDTLALTTANAEQGSITISNNMLVYTPLNGFEGVDNVVYMVSDSNGGESQGQLSITINASETTIVETEPSSNSAESSSGGSFGFLIFIMAGIILFIRRVNNITINDHCK